MTGGRLTNLGPADLDREQLAVYEALTSGKRRSAGSLFAITDDSGALYGPFATFLVQPGLGMAVQRVGEELRFASRLNPTVRELVILTVAAYVRSGYEWYAHAAVAASLGIEELVLSAVKSGQAPPGLSTEESAAVRLAQTVLDRAVVDEGHYAEAAESLSPAGVMEVVTIVGYYRLLADLMDVFHPPLPPEATGVFDGRGPAGERQPTTRRHGRRG